MVLFPDIPAHPLPAGWLPSGALFPPPRWRRELISHWITLGHGWLPIGSEKGAGGRCAPASHPPLEPGLHRIMGGRRQSGGIKYSGTTFMGPGLSSPGAEVPSQQPVELRPHAPQKLGDQVIFGCRVTWPGRARRLWPWRPLSQVW